MVDLRPLLSHNCPTATGAIREYNAVLLKSFTPVQAKLSGKTSEQLGHHSSAKAFLQQPVNLKETVKKQQRQRAPHQSEIWRELREAEQQESELSRSQGRGEGKHS